MNSSYKLVYSEALNTWVAVAEHVSARGKKSAMRRATSAALLACGAAVSGWALAAPPLISPPLVNQLPTGGQVAAGAVAISQTQTAAAASMAIAQTSNQAIVNWQTFNVGANATVNISQPGSSSVLLNRVLDANPSQIFGQINANGQVFLSNPNGVYFAQGSSVDVGSFTATTHGISDSDFMSGKYNFSRNGATGSILNQGSITAGLGGYIALLAPEVQNQGVVVAQLGGTVAMAAGESFQLQFNANKQLTNVLVTPATIQTLVDNGNAVRAPGGLIILSAQAAHGLLGGVVKNSGEISATGLVSEGGVIRLTASHRIELAQTSSIMADAAAGRAGKGGRIEVIADLSNAASLTQVDGALSAKGGDLGGDGGFVETSAARLAIGGNTLVSTGAPKGRSGTWLLDPYDVTIVDSATESGTVYADDLTADATTVILTSSINNSLAANTNVTISTGLSTDGSAANYSQNNTGNIYLNGNISWNTAATLKLDANKDIFIGTATKTGTITVAGAGTLTLNPGTLHYWNADSTQYIDTGGRILMGMAATPTAGLTTGYWNGTAFTTGAATGFNGQVNVSPAATLNINDVPYTVIHSQSAFEAINNTGSGYVVGSHLDFAGKTYTGSPVRTITKNFNGLGHQISNLTISQGGNNTAGVGLFGEIGEYYSNRNFSNLGLTGSVTTTSAGEVGSLAGVMSFTRVSNVYSTASVTATLNAGSYYGYGDVGGLIGQVSNWGTYGLTNAYATGKVTVNTNTGVAVGGLVGQNAPGGHMGINIDHSYATGNVEVNVSNGSVSVGGLVGSYSGSGGELNYNHATGNITVTGGNNNSVGGLVGSATSGGGPYTFNYATGAVTNSGSGNHSSTGGLFGYLQTSSIANSFATGTVTSSSDYGSAGGLVGFYRTGGNPSLSNSYTSNSVTGPALSDYSGSGALVGRIENWDGPLTLTSNYYDSTKSGSLTGVGGIGSQTYAAFPNASNQVTALSTAAMKSASSFSSGFGNSGGSFTAASGWGYGGSYNSGLPVLCALTSCVSDSSGVSATTLYLLPVSGQSSVYGSAPSISYLFYTSSDGTGTSYSATTVGATGSLNYAITKGGSAYSASTLTSSDGAGTYGLTYSSGVSLTNGSYVLANSGYSTPINYTISKAQLTVTPNNQTRYYGDPNPTFSQTITGFVLGETSSTAGITGSGVGSSVATVSTGVSTATILGDSGTYAASNYDFTAANGALTINPRPITVTATDQSRAYGSANPTSGSVTLSSGSLANSDALGAASVAAQNTATPTANAGTTHTLTPSAQAFSTGSVDNYAITYADGTLSITQAPLTVTANNSSKTYGDTKTFAGTEFSSSGLVNGETIGSMILFSTGMGPSAGVSASPYTINPSAATGGSFSADNYAITYTDGTLTVNPRPITVTAVDQSRAYGGANPTTGSVTLSSGSLANSDALGAASVAAQNTATSTANAGTTHMLTPSAQSFSTGEAGNYAISYADGTLSISQRPITITATDQSRTYGSANPTSGGVILSSGSLANSDALGLASVAAQNTATSTAHAGTTHTLTPSAQTFSMGSATNYAISYANGTLFIGQAQLTITANNTSKTYDAQAYSGGAGVTYGGFLNGDVASVLSGTLSYSGTSQGAVNAGNYTLIPGGLSSSNYFLSYVGSSMLINKAALTATGNSASVTYNGANQMVSGFTVSGLQGSDTVNDLRSVTAAGASGKNAGSYTNAVSAGSETNYNVSTVAGSLDITKANATVTANSGTLTYSGTNQTVSGFTASGLVGGETTAALTGVSASRTEKNAGTYATTASGSSGNYELSFIGGSMLISKAALTATANSASVTYNGEAYMGGHGVTYSGFVNSENAAVLGGALGYYGSSQGAKNAGSYVITPSGLSSGNYNLSYVDGTLTVRPAPLTVSVLDVSKTFDGTTSANASPVVVSGQLYGKDALKGGNFQFGNATPGIRKTVAVSGVGFSEELSAGNYLLTLVPNTNSTILAAPVGVPVVAPVVAAPPLGAASITAPSSAPAPASAAGSSASPAASSGATSSAATSTSASSAPDASGGASSSSSASQGSATSSSTGTVSASGSSTGGSASGGSASGSASSGSSSSATGSSSGSSSSAASPSTSRSSSSSSSSGSTSSGTSKSGTSSSSGSGSGTGARSGDKSAKAGSQSQKASGNGRSDKSTLAKSNASVGKSSKSADAAAVPGKSVPAKPGAAGNSAAQNRSRLQANGSEKGTNLPKAGSGARAPAAAPSLAARAASIAAARQAKTNTPQPNGTSKLASAAAPKVASLASRAAALAPSRQIRVGAGNASNLPVATLSARAETLGISGINKGMGNISANLMAQAAERYRIQASLPELTEAKKAEGNSAAMQAVAALDAITVSVCETGCTKEQSNSVLAVQIQMQTSGNPMAAPADTRRDSFHHMPWKNNSGLMNSGRSRTVADFTENLEDVNLMGTLNLFIIP